MSSIIAGPFRRIDAGEGDPQLPRPNSLRRAHASTRLAVAAAAGVLEEAAIPVSDRVGVYVGQQHLPADYSRAFIDTARRDGPRLASPVHFSESVANNVASHLSMTLHLTGIIETYIGTRVAGLNALEAAMQDLRFDAIDEALVVVLCWSQEITRAGHLAVWRPRATRTDEMELFNGALAFALRRREGKGLQIRSVATGCRGIGLPASIATLRELWTPGDDARVLLSCLGLERAAALKGLGAAFPGLPVHPSPTGGRGEAFALDPFLQLLEDLEAEPGPPERVILVAGEEGIAGVLRTTRNQTG